MRPRRKTPEVKQLREALADARSWARHGYEIGQRSCTWSDHGVAPKWLTEGHRPEALESNLAAHVVELERYRAALAALVRLKDGPRDAAYERDKPAAWDLARRLLGEAATDE